MKRTSTLIKTLLLLVFVQLFAQQADINTIHARSKATILALSKVNVEEVTNSLASMRSDGSWADVNYADKSITGWSPIGHMNRLLAMAVAFQTPGTTLYRNVDKNKILLGLNYYRTLNPTSNNWWYTDINSPRVYGQVLILMKGEYPAATLKATAVYIKDNSTKYALDGDNMMNVCTITIYKAIAEDNYSLMQKAFRILAESLAIFPSVPAPNLGDVGIKSDFSYHQHRQQLYIGGYGLSYINGLLGFMEMTPGTSFDAQFTPEKKQLFSKLLLEGVQRIGHRGVIDFGSTGRSVARSNGTRGISEATLVKAKAIDPENAGAYDAWINHLKGGPSGISGNKHFWKSDIMTQKGADYYMSAKIISKRSLGTESINFENRKFFHLPLGATNIMVDGDEYFNIFPMWDWTRIPGTTAELNPNIAPYPTEGTYLFGSNDYGGGVSNGTAGFTAFEHDYYGVRAKKSYFFMNNMMLCMGTGITASKANTVVTSVNQSFLSGSVTVGSSEGTQVLSGNAINQTSSSVKWIHHDNVAYLIPSGGQVTFKGVPQSGTWKDISTPASATSFTKNVFSLWFNHSNNPSNRSYLYIVAPNKTAAETQTISDDHGFVVVRNDASIQAVRNDKVKQYAVVFYAAGTVDMGDGLTISSDKKAMVLIERKGTPTYKISVVDPLCTQSSAKITLNKNLQGPNAVYANGQTSFNVAFPTGEYTGKDVTNFYTIVTPSVSITSPQTTTPFNAPSIVNIAAEASPAAAGVGIAKVEFYNGAAKIGEDNTAPFTFTWTNVSAGNYTLTAKATDIHGISGTSAPVIIRVNNLDVSLCQSVVASTNDGNVESNTLDNNISTRWSADGVGQWIQFCLSEPQTINGVQMGFYLGNTRKFNFNIQTSLNGTTWNTVLTGGLSSGTTLQLETFSIPSHSAKFVRIIGNGNTGNTWNSYTEVKILNGTQSNLAPSISVNTPPTTLIAPAEITLTANASDADGSIAVVEFYNGTTLIGTDNSAPYSMTWGNVAAGNYSVSARATDNLGLSNSSPMVTVQVNAALNKAPTVSLTSPTSGASFNAPASISLTASASDQDGTISKVEFYSGTILLASDNSAPYSFTYTAATGNYSFTAKAFDNAGASAISAARTVSVVSSSVCAGIAEYVENGNYVAGSKVKVGNKHYECKEHPYSGWCNGSAWAYGPGTGAYWSDAWYERGSCTSSLTRTTEEIISKPLMGPNPATDLVYIHSTESVEVSIFNHQGIQIYSNTMTSGGAIDVRHFPAGMYIVKMNTGAGIITQTLMKQ